MLKKTTPAAQKRSVALSRWSMRGANTGHIRKDAIRADEDETKNPERGLAVAERGSTKKKREGRC